jgi:hypothetical protein
MSGKDFDNKPFGIKLRQLGVDSEKKEESESVSNSEELKSQESFSSHSSASGSNTESKSSFDSGSSSSSYSKKNPKITTDVVDSSPLPNSPLRINTGKWSERENKLHDLEEFEHHSQSELHLDSNSSEDTEYLSASTV